MSRWIMKPGWRVNTPLKMTAEIPKSRMAISQCFPQR
jgi:hypothetical protein